MLREIKHIFMSPDPIELMEHELRAARCALLEAETGLDFASSMVTYHRARITRLRGQLQSMPRAGTAVAPSLHSDDSARADIAADPTRGTETRQTNPHPTKYEYYYV